MTAPRRPDAGRRHGWELPALTVLALLTRCIALGHPNAVVFDERLVEQYAGAYFTGRFYFDVHPPLGKLLIAGAARVLSVPGSVLVNIEPAVHVRILPAVAGALLVPLLWLLLRQLGAGRTAATLGASLLLLDNGLLVQSRFILLDTMLMAFGLAALTSYLASRKRRGFGAWALLAASGICAGLSASVKWTGLAALGLLLLALAYDVVTRRATWLSGATRAATLTAAACAVYAASFAVHFALLRRSGPGDAFMPPAFQATLEGNPRHSPGAHMSFARELVDLNVAMARGESALEQLDHPYASPWYAWPLMIRPLHLWRSEPLAGGRIENIHLLGNPIVWLGALVGVCIAVVALMRRDPRVARHRLPLLFLLAGVVIDYLPLAAVRRVLFIYSYFPALVLEIAVATYGLGALLGWIDEPDRLFAFPDKRSASAYWLILAVATTAFLAVAPISYGWPTAQHGLYEYTPYHAASASNGAGSRGIAHVGVEAVSVSMRGAVGGGRRRQRGAARRSTFDGRRPPSCAP